MPLSAFTNIFAGNPLDRASAQRTNPDWLRTAFDNAQSRTIILWNGAPLIKAASDGGFHLSFLPLSSISHAAERSLFLGLSQGTAVFALDFEDADDPSEGVLSGLGHFDRLRELALLLPAAEAAIAATAKAVFEWQRRHPRCSLCGEPSHVTEGGWKRVCSACQTEHFPRTDPVVIMLPIRGDMCLLGRQASWPEGMWSAFAGFLEPGESIEEACARELKEEAALDTLAVHYHSSQPWPFPASLMIGLFAEVGESEAVPDLVEIEAVRWFTRDQAASLLDGKIESIFAPSRMAIAHTLLRAWIEM